MMWDAPATLPAHRTGAITARDFPPKSKRWLDGLATADPRPGCYSNSLLSGIVI